jgi:hypothetical protein
LEGLFTRQRETRTNHQPTNTMKTTTTIRLRNKLTGLYYVDGKNFSGTESEANVYEMNSPSHLVINHTFDNVETVPAKKRGLSLKPGAVIPKDDEGDREMRLAKYGDSTAKFHIVPTANGVEKLFQRVGPRPYYSAAGKQWTQPTWKLMGYRKDGKFSRTLRGLKSKLK